MYPIVTTAFIVNPSYTITPVTNPNMTIDGSPVITSFAWVAKAGYPPPSGMVSGNSKSTFIDNQPVVICDPTVSTFYTPISQSVLSD